jgi:hypothetical protein
VIAGAREVLGQLGGTLRASGWPRRCLRLADFPMHPSAPRRRDAVVQGLAVQRMPEGIRRRALTTAQEDVAASQRHTESMARPCDDLEVIQQPPQRVRIGAVSGGIEELGARVRRLAEAAHSIFENAGHRMTPYKRRNAPRLCNSTASLKCGACGVGMYWKRK